MTDKYPIWTDEDFGPGGIFNAGQVGSPDVAAEAATRRYVAIMERLDELSLDMAAVLKALDLYATAMAATVEGLRRASGRHDV